jgi:hypothetical protein
MDIVYDLFFSMDILISIIAMVNIFKSFTVLQFMISVAFPELFFFYLNSLNVNTDGYWKFFPSTNQLLAHLSQRCCCSVFSLADRNLFISGQICRKSFASHSVLGLLLFSLTTEFILPYTKREKINLLPKV